MTANKRYNILHVIDKFSMDGQNPSSCALLIRNWYRYADQERFNLMTCGLKKEEPAARIYNEEGMKCFFLGNGKYSVRNVGGLTDLIERENIHLLHLHGYSSANFGRLAAWQKSIANIVHEHAIMRVLPHQYLADYMLRGKTDAAVAVSKAVKQFLVKGRHVPEKLIRVIWNGIDLSLYHKSPESRIQKLRDGLAIPPDTIALGTITRLREEKGNEFLIRAIPRIVAKLPNVKFFIVGDGPLKEKLYELRARLHLQQHLSFLGFRRDVADLFSLFDIVVIPSISEGFGLAMAEAMAMGKPVVASEVGGLVELGKDSDAALFVPPANPQALADGITKLIKNPALCKGLAISAQNESRKFGIQANVDQLQDMYLQMLRNGNSSNPPLNKKDIFESEKSVT